MVLCADLLILGFYCSLNSRNKYAKTQSKIPGVCTAPTATLPAPCVGFLRFTVFHLFNRIFKPAEILILWSELWKSILYLLFSLAVPWDFLNAGFYGHCRLGSCQRPHFVLHHSCFKMLQMLFSPFQFENTLEDFGHPLFWEGRHQTPMILMQMLMSSAERTWFYSSGAGVTQATSSSAPQGSLFYVEKSCPNALHISKCHFGHFPSVIFVHLSLSFLIFYHESRHGNGLC